MVVLARKAKWPDPAPIVYNKVFMWYINTAKYPKVDHENVLKQI